MTIASAAESPSEVISRRELLAMFRERLSGEERTIAELRMQGHDWAAVAGSSAVRPKARRKQFARAVARVGEELGLDTVTG